MAGFLPFALPDIGEEEIAEVVDSLRSGWITTGPKTKLFEQNFAQFINGAELNKDGVEAIAVNSATSGLHLSLEAIGIGPGDEVITTPFTFTATAEVVRYLGANPVFVDINPATLNLDPDKIEAAITPRTKAIIPVHFAGLACDMTKILGLAQQYGLKVVEDAAHALPTTYQNSLIGSLGSDTTVFSFYATKTIATGEGGMVVTRNPELASRCRVMRLHGINRDAFDRYTSTKPGWHYEVVAPGFKYNMGDLAASLGIQQLKKAWRFRQKREQLAEVYHSELVKLPIQLPPKPPDGDTHAWHLYVIRLTEPDRLSRNKFIELMSAKGIGCSVHFIPLHLQPYWRDKYSLQPQDFPQALAAYENIISLPLYTKMTEADQARVIKAVHQLLT